MKNALLILSLCLLSSVIHAQKRTTFNGDFEELDFNSKPRGWTSSSSMCYADSVIKKSGKYAFALVRTNEAPGFVNAGYSIRTNLKGAKLEMRGYLKIKDVEKGFAAFWLRIDDKSGSILAFDNMQLMHLSGSKDWKEYRIQLPYNDLKAVHIMVGGLLSGKGTMWMDDVRLYINGQPILQQEPDYQYKMQ